MKKRLRTILKALLVSASCIAVLALTSYRKALRVEDDVLKECLSPSISYNRVVRFGALNPFSSILPHWTITYVETPTSISYDTPSITVNLLGQVADWRSKEVLGALVEKGYRDSY
jgi:hypothetical protein